MSRPTEQKQGAPLSSVRLFRDLGPSQLSHVAERCSFRRLDRDAVLLEATELSSDLYFLLDGKLIARGRSPRGKEIRFLTIEAGDMFGEFSAIDGAPRSAEIVAETDALVASMKGSHLRELMLLIPPVALTMCELLVAKQREMSKRMEEFTTLNVRDRVRAALLRMTHRHDGELRFPPTQYEIAVDAGTNRETVSREMADLARRGVIAYDRSRLSILQPDALRRGGAGL